MQALGYTFRDEALLRRALTHPSAGKEDNQRLEFLGDAVLQFIMSEKLYAAHPDEREGALTHRRALLVCEAAQSPIARELGIGEALRMDRGEELTGGREKPSVLCDAMEAVLAASYLDGGMDVPRDIIRRFILEKEPVTSGNRDYKTRFQELVQRSRDQVISYTLTGSSGPDHNKSFTVEVSLNGQVVGSGAGSSKKRAEQEAAKAAMIRLFPEEQA